MKSSDIYGRCTFNMWKFTDTYHDAYHDIDACLCFTHTNSLPLCYLTNSTTPPKTTNSTTPLNITHSTSRRRILCPHELKESPTSHELNETSRIRRHLRRTTPSTSPMGWLRSVESIKLWVSFAEYRLFYRALLQKRPIILSILLTVATPYLKLQPPWNSSWSQTPAGVFAQEPYKRDYILQQRLIFLKSLLIIATPRLQRRHTCLHHPRDQAPWHVATHLNTKNIGLFCKRALEMRL